MHQLEIDLVYSNSIRVPDLEMIVTYRNLE